MMNKPSMKLLKCRFCDWQRPFKWYTNKKGEHKTNQGTLDFHIACRHPDEVEKIEHELSKMEVMG